MRYAELSLGAQTAYAELLEQTQALEMRHHLGRLKGSFHRKKLKGRDYWYFAWRDLDGGVRFAYVGPDDERVRRLIERHAADKAASLEPRARAAIALGCAALPARHYRIVRRLADYGFFRAGGLLVGTHAFVALGNLLGVRWGDADRTLDVDFAHAGRNVSVALPANIRVDVHEALASLEMGLLPISQFGGEVGAQYRNPRDPELRLDFVTPGHRGGAKPVQIPHLNVALQPLKFMEYSLEEVTQGAVFAAEGATVVNLPAPARYAVHKLIVHGERPARERAKAVKDLHQAACLAEYFARERPRELNAAWRDALQRGPGWRKRARAGRAALLKLAPELDKPALWRE
ncbi:MAG: GSU2403 family nucleotidyltransferase fold protein [Nitrospiraceae bacterium]